MGLHIRSLSRYDMFPLCHTRCFGAMVMLQLRKNNVPDGGDSGLDGFAPLS